MKLIYILCTIVLIQTIVSCKKNDSSDDFAVSTSKTTFKVGENVLFNIAGNPDLLTVYTGDLTHNYAYKNRDSASLKPEISLSTYRFSGAQLNSMSLLVSTNFSGNYTVAGIQAATWTDITSRAILSTGTDNTQSGIIDISDIVPTYKNFVFAFKKHDDMSATLKPQSWTIRTFFVYQLLPDNSTRTVTDITGTTTSWQAIDVLNPSILGTVSTTLSFPGGAVNTAENEDWIVSKLIHPYQLNPDRGIVIKGLADSPVQQYSYKYTAPGTYDVTFVSGKADNSSLPQNVKTIQITVTP